jgi:hypothetical protein
MTSLVLGVAAAVAGSALYNAGIAFQALDARTISARHSLRVSLLQQLVRRGRWLVGTFLGLIAWPFHAVALLLAPLTVVQPALASGLFLLLGAGARLLGERVGKREVLGVTAISAGMAGVVWAAPSRSDEHAGASTLVPVLLGLGLIALVPYGLRLFGSPAAGGLIAAFGAGVAFSATGITTKLFADSADMLAWLPIVLWLALTGLGAGIAVISEMTALQTRAATRVAPVVFAVETMIPVLLAPVVVHEGWGSTPLGGAALLLSLAALVGGVVALTSSRAVSGILAAEANAGRETAELGDTTVNRGQSRRVRAYYGPQPRSGRS